MWIGTENGLNRYDGHSFKIFRPGKGNSISNEMINDIAGDSNGKIWVATMAGLNCYDPATDHWEVLLPGPKKRKNDIPNIIIWDLWFDDSGLLWIAPDVFEFCSYDIAQKKFTYYNWPQFARKSLMSESKGNYHSIQRFTKKNDHEFWLGTTKGLVSLNITSGEFTFIGGGFYGDVYDIKYDVNTKKVFLSAQYGYLFNYNEKNNRYEAMTAMPEPYPSVEFANLNRNEIWMASENGLLKIDPVNNRASVTVTIALAGSLLPGGTKSVFTDNNGIRWIGTPNGITSIDYANLNSAFLPLIAASDKDGINRISGVHFDSVENKYFVCSVNPAAVFIINSLTGKIDKITKDRSGNSFTGCNLIKEDSDKNIWLLTRTNVFRYDRLQKSFSKFAMPNKDSTVVYRDMVQDAEGNFWFATFHRGLYYYITATKEFRQLNDSLANFLRSSVSSLYADNEHKEIWIGTFGNNLFKYSLTEKKLTLYAETEKVKDYVSFILIDDICADSKNNIWIATNSGGLMRYNRGQPYEKSFTRFDMKSGLVSNNIISVAADTGTVLWYLTGSGLQAVNLNGQPVTRHETGRLFNFATYVNDFSVPHEIFFAKQRQELLVGAGGGLLFYQPYKTQALSTFPLVFTLVEVDDKKINIIPGKGYAKMSLPYATKSLTIKFAGLYYGISDEIEYEYMLDGYDKKWQRAGKSYKATYQNLPTGNYSFSVRAIGKNNKVVTELSGLAFTIPPYFWQTWWFTALIFFLIIASVYWIIHSLLQKLKEEEQLNAFATSLYGQHTIDDIFWDTAQNCIKLLGFVDCVIYERDEKNHVLTQRAAAGPKNPGIRRDILNRIEIPEDKGIVGFVSRTGKTMLIKNTNKEPRYIVDDERRLSEITVPVFVEGKVFAVIDSEHPSKNFFTRRHLQILKKIAAICAERILKYLTEEKLRTKIARDLHDEMGSTLTSINVLSKVGMQSPEVSEEVKNYLQKIKDNSGKMMESMSDIVWAINPANDSLEQVLMRIKEFTAEMLEPARINYYFDVRGDLDKSLLNLEQRKDLYMIFKEALNNAVKYSGATEITIGLIRNETMLQMQITDNGKGFDTGIIHSGNGLKNIQSRARAMQADITIKSIENAGTTILLEKTIT